MVNTSERLEKKGFLFLFSLILITGLFYLFFIPPWQSPDECRHFAYGILIGKDKKLEPSLDKEIVESMDTFHAWKYQSVNCPHPLPNRLKKVPFYGVIVGKVSGKSTLYYSLNSYIIKKLKIKGILNQFYMVRSISFLFFILSVYFTYLSARIIFKENFLYCLAAVSLVSFLPQFLIISTSVNPVNLAILLETVLIYLIIRSLHSDNKWPIAIFGSFLIALGFLNDRIALFMIPPFLVLLFIYFFQSIRIKQLKKILIYSVIIIFLSVGLFLLIQYFFPSLLRTILEQSIVKRGIRAISKFLQFFPLSSTKSILSFFCGFFMSFWYVAGWMRFPYIIDIYSVLVFICLLVGLGLLIYLYNYFIQRKPKTSISFNTFLVLMAAVISLLVGTIISKFPRLDPGHGAQGRYIFPAISAIGILFVLGLKEITPEKWERWVPLFVIFGFVVLDVYTLFHPLVRAFYFFRNF